MFSNNPVSQSMIDAVNKVLGETPQEVKPAQPVEQPKNPFAPQMLDESDEKVDPEESKCVTEPKAKEIAKKEVKGHEKKLHQKEEEEKLLLEPKADKVPTPTGMKVFGSSYGNSAKARKDQTTSSIDKLKGPSNKSLAKEDMTFADKLKSSITENKATGTEEIFTDNNLGEEEMSDKQKAKREKIVLSMKDKQADFKQRYGKNWKNVMYATATKQAMAEEVVDESFEDEHGIGKSPKKNQDVADKAYLKHKPGTVKGTLTQLGRFLKGKPEIKEDIEVQVDKSGDTITTDMLRGRVSGGKLNSFRNYKVDLKSSGEEPVPVECDKGVDTKEKQKISTNPGPVDIKLDDKLTTPPHTYFSKDKQIKNEEVRGELKSIRSKQYKMQDKEVTDFRNKHIPGGLVTSNEEVESLDEDNLDDIAKKHGMEFNRTTYGAGMKHPKHGEISINRYGEWHHTGTKAQGNSTDKFASLDKHLSSLKEDIIDEKVIAGTPGWEKTPKDVKDKSGAVHTPMSRAKDLARLSFKKIKSDLGKNK